MLFHARGFAPCIPAPEPEAARAEPAEQMPDGGLPFWLLAYPAFSLLFCPPSPTGKGEIFSLFRRGLRPRHPGISPLAALTEPAKRVPGGRNPRFAAKPKEPPFLLAEPAAKERGDRGRGTSAFEMVLSPGAGRASAARDKLLAGHHNGRDSQCRAGSAPPPGTTAAGIADTAAA